MEIKIDITGVWIQNLPPMDYGDFKLYQYFNKFLSNYVSKKIAQPYNSFKKLVTIIPTYYFAYTY